MLRNQAGGKFETTEFLYQQGIVDHVRELAGEEAMTSVQFWQAERKVRDRADKPEYPHEDQCGAGVFKPEPSDRILPQFQLAGARRRAGQGGAQRVCLARSTRI